MYVFKYIHTFNLIIRFKILLKTGNILIFVLISPKIDKLCVCKMIFIYNYMYLCIYLYILCWFFAKK